MRWEAQNWQLRLGDCGVCVCCFVVRCADSDGSCRLISGETGKTVRERDSVTFKVVTDGMNGVRRGE